MEVQSLLHEDFIRRFCALPREKNESICTDWGPQLASRLSITGFDGIEGNPLIENFLTRRKITVRGRPIASEEAFLAAYSHSAENVVLCSNVE